MTLGERLATKFPDHTIELPLGGKVIVDGVDSKIKFKALELISFDVEKSLEEGLESEISKYLKWNDVPVKE